MREIFLFAVNNGSVTLLGATEENNNGGAYPDRVQLFGQDGWKIPSEKVRTNGLVQTFSAAPGYFCGDIYFDHEEPDSCIDALDCLIRNRAAREQEIHWLLSEVSPSLLKDGLYII